MCYTWATMFNPDTTLRDHTQATVYADLRFLSLYTALRTHDRAAAKLHARELRDWLDSGEPYPLCHPRAYVDDMIREALA